MRKDLKIGLAIGAVLLVVLIVYLAVPRGDNDIAQGGGAGDGSQAVVPSTEGAGNGEASSEPSKRDGSTSSGAGASDTKAGKTSDPFATKTGTSDKKTDDATGATASAGAEVDVWATALEKGELPSLSAVKTETAGPAIKSTTPKSLESADTSSNKAKPEIETPAAIDPPADTGKRATDSADTATGATPRTHKVQRGEDYSKIAKLVYGDAKYYLKIEEANPGLDATRLKPGTEIKLPDISAAKSSGKTASASDTSASASSASEKKLGSDEYRVQSGDSLYKIAMKRYGSSNMVDAIYEANKQTIGSDSAKLKADMVLKMPANPAEKSPR